MTRIRGRRPDDPPEVEIPHRRRADKTALERGLAAAKEYGWLVALVFGGWVALGGRNLTPNDRVTAVESEVKALREDLRVNTEKASGERDATARKLDALIRLRCLDVSRHDAAAAGLDCPQTRDELPWDRDRRERSGATARPVPPAVVALGPPRPSPLLFIPPTPVPRVP